MTTTEKQPTAAEKLAALIPSPDTPIAKKEIEATELESPVATTVGGPPPPIQTLELEQPKPTTRRGRGKASAATNASTTKDLQKMLPSAVRVHVYKRSRSGQMGFVNDYSANDLSAQGTVERFLKEYVVPEYDYGEYSLYIQRPGKSELEPISSVTIEPPLSHRKKNGSNGSDTKELLELIMKRDDQARAEAANRKSPMEEMKEALSVVSALSGDKGSSMDPSMLMMMMMMKDKERPPAGPDPILLKIIDRLDRMDDDRHLGAMMPPPPPPPPPPPVADPMDGFAAMMRVLSEQQASSNALLIEAIKSKAPDRDPVADLASLTRLTGTMDDRITTKDLMTMLPTIKNMISPNPGKNSISEALETLRSVKILEREFSPSAESQASSSFWDFLRDFVTSDMGSRVAEAVTAQKNAASLEQRHAERRLASENIPDEGARGEDGAIKIPETFRTKHAVEINNAAEPSERLRAFIQSLQHLGAFPEWRPYVAKIFGLAKQNRRIETLEFLSNFLQAFVDHDVLTEDAATNCINDMDSFWVLVRQQLNMPDIDEVYPEGYEPPSQEAEASVVEVDEGSGEDHIDRPSQPMVDAARTAEPADAPAQVIDSIPEPVAASS